MPYAMYITEYDWKKNKNGKKKKGEEKGIVQFPVVPGKITMQVNGKNETISLISGGEVNLIKSPGLTDITIDELLLPTLQAYPFAVYEDGFHGAEYYLGKLEKWKKSKNPVQFKVIRTSPDGKNLLWDTTMDVTVENYKITEDAEQYAPDVAVKLSLKEYRYWGAKKAKKAARTYTVKKGDTLLKIARKQLGDGSKRKDIYKLNKKRIENAAKKHGRKSSSNGRYLYKGTVLKLPSS